LALRTAVKRGRVANTTHRRALARRRDLRAQDFGDREHVGVVVGAAGVVAVAFVPSPNLRWRDE
jgi:hypothetical protein